MQTRWEEPNANNAYLAEHVCRLLDSLHRLNGRHLVDPEMAIRAQARALFEAPFVVLSHDTAEDPLLNYANRAGLSLFEFTWTELIAMPSRRTAEPAHQEERARLLAAVARQGFIDDYRGIRIARSGRRFIIERATVWNLLDENGAAYGQAATFADWRFLE